MVFSIGIDTERFARADRLPGRTRIIGVDHLDHDKGPVERFQGFERFAETRPARRGMVTLLMIAPLSRSEVPEHHAIRHLLKGTILYHSHLTHGRAARWPPT